jgi:hypothetical protein
VGFEFRETVFRAFTDFDLGDIIGVQSTALQSNDSAQVVGLTFSEDDVNEIIRVAVDLAAPLPDPQAQHKQATLGNASSISSMTKEMVGDQNWTVVGAFSNGWSNVGGAYVMARYRKDGMGFVHIEGSLTGGTIGNLAAFTLPVGYRPAARLTFAGVSGAVNRADVDATGNVIPYSGANGLFALSSLTFYADR